MEVSTVELDQVVISKKKVVGASATLTSFLGTLFLEDFIKIAHKAKRLANQYMLTVEATVTDESAISRARFSTDLAGDYVKAAEKALVCANIYAQAAAAAPSAFRRADLLEDYDYHASYVVTLTKSALASAVVVASCANTPCNGRNQLEAATSIGEYILALLRT
jgi:hypothetical protein